MQVSFGLLVLKTLQAADVKSESNPMDPSSIEICAAKDPLAPELDANKDNCPNASTGQDLLCRLFSILPLAANTENLATSTSLLDASVFDMAGTEAGNGATIVTVLNNGCKPDQCRHTDGSTTSLTFAYDLGDPNAVDANGDPAPVAGTYIITATCDCDELKGETAIAASDTGYDAADPFKCICDKAQDRVQL